MAPNVTSEQQKARPCATKLSIALVPLSSPPAFLTPDTVPPCSRRHRQIHDERAVFCPIDAATTL
ncbi:hypothetical protein EON65_57630 [archaeon]|nr:MAG: hypothetical protein EON65_57630 [archaeon]